MDRTRGPVSCFAEPDYRFGAGPLWMRVERVDWNRPVRYDDDNWYEVDGVETTSDGRDIGRRQALVRARTLSVVRREPRP